jgi:transcriptional antiterminator RfaH
MHNLEPKRGPMTLDSEKPRVKQGNASPSWYVVATKSRQEAVAAQNLRWQGYGVFLPIINLKKRRRGHWVSETEPLFPGYVFLALQLGRDDPIPIRSTVGCIGLVRFGQAYTPMPADFMASLRAVEDLTAAPPSQFSAGDIVKIETGPFAGIEAVFDMAKGKDRAQVLVNILGKPQRLKVGVDGLSNWIISCVPKLDSTIIVADRGMKYSMMSR